MLEGLLRSASHCQFTAPCGEALLGWSWGRPAAMFFDLLRSVSVTDRRVARLDPEKKLQTSQEWTPVSKLVKQEVKPCWKPILVTRASLSMTEWRAEICGNPRAKPVGLNVQKKWAPPSFCMWPHSILLNFPWHLWHNLIQYSNNLLAWILTRTNLTLPPPYLLASLLPGSQHIGTVGCSIENTAW